MMQDTYTAPPAIQRLADQLRAARAAHPPSLVRQWMDDPALYRRACEEARQRASILFPHLFGPDLLRRLTTSTEVVIGDDDSVEDAGPVEPVKRRKVKPTLARQSTLPPMATSVSAL